MFIKELESRNSINKFARELANRSANPVCTQLKVYRQHVSSVLRVSFYATTLFHEIIRYHNT